MLSSAMMGPIATAWSRLGTNTDFFATVLGMRLCAVVIEKIQDGQRASKRRVHRL